MNEAEQHDGEGKVKDNDRVGSKSFAEQRRANAIAREQEMKAAVAANRAQVFLAEAEVPRAMADAFRQGNLERLSRNGAS